MEINFDWKETYSVGDDSLDLEHREIIEDTNELYWAIVEKQDRETLLSILDRLIRNTFDHFRHEEQLFEDCSYPRFREHKTHHEYLRKLLMELKKCIHLTLGYYLLCYCIEWWIVHILSQDKKYIPYLQQTVFAYELQ